MADPKLPRPDDEEEDEGYQDGGEEDTINDDPGYKEKPSYASYIRIVVIVSVIVLFLLLILTWSKKDDSQIQPEVILPDTTQVLQPKKDVPVAKTPETSTQQAAPTPTTTPSIDGQLINFQYIIRSGKVSNGETTIGLVKDGHVLISIKDQFFDVTDAQIIRNETGKIVSIAVGPTTYVTDKETADALGIESRSPYNAGVRKACKYKIRSGDTAQGIANRHAMTLQELKSRNRSKDLSYLVAGEQLNVLCNE